MGWAAFRIGVFLLAYWIWPHLHLFAQDIPNKHFTREDGLVAEKMIFSITKDHQGYLWFCSSSGIDRFDGRRFKFYKPSADIGERNVLRAFNGTGDQVWFQTYHGKLIGKKNDRFFLHPHQDSIKHYLSRTVLRGIQAGLNGSLYIATRLSGLHHMDSLGRLRPLVESHAGYQGIGVVEDPLLDEAMVFSVCDSSISVLQQRLYHFDLSGQLQKSTSTPISQSNARQMPFFSAGPGGCFAIGQGNQLLVFRGDSLYASRNMNHPINTVLADSFGGIWVGMRFGGIGYFPNVELDQETILLKGYGIHDLQGDGQRGVWAATYHDGLYYYPYPDRRRYSELAGVSLATGDGPRLCKAQDRLYVVAEGSRLLCYYPNGKVQEIPIKSYLERQEDSNISRIRYCNGAVYVIGYRSILQVDIASEKISPFSLADWPRANWPTNFVPSIDGQSTWMVLRREILRVQDTLVKERLPALPDEIYCLAQASDGMLWLGGSKGLWSFSQEGYRYHGDEHPALKAVTRQLSIFRNELWISTEKGIVIRGEPISGDVLTFSPGISGFLNFQHDEDTTWVSNASKMFKITRPKHDSLGIVGIYPLPFRSEVYSSFELLRDTFFIPSNKGLLIVSRRSLGKGITPPNPIIEKVRINERDTSLLPDYKLAYNQNLIYISFTGISFASGSGKGLKLKHRMLGMHSHWKLTEERGIQYTKIPPGSYCFELKAVAVDGTESLEPAQVHFVILPPFWATWWFALIASIIFVLLLWLVFHLRLKALKKKATERLEAERHMVRLELKALRAQMNPHFTFNSINTIQSYLLRKDVDKAGVHLRKLASLIRLILSHSNREYVRLDEELKALELYLDLEVMRLGGRLRYSIQAEDAIDSGFAEIPPMLIQPYVENAVQHGIANKEEEGMVSIQFYQSRDCLKCIIEDDGIGRVQSEKIKRSQAQSPRPMGISITQERLQLMSQKMKLAEVQRFIDLKDSHGRPNGTRVELIIPYR